MDNSGEKNSERAKQEALATLGIYALERNNITAVMERAIDLSCVILHLDCAVIFSLYREDDSETLRIGAQAGCAKDGSEVDINKENFDITYAIEQDKPTIVERYSSENRFNISPFLEEAEIESSIHLVIKGSDDKFGLLGFYSREYREFDKDEIAFLQILAHMVGMAMEKNDMLNHLEEKNEELKQKMDQNHDLQQQLMDNNILQRWDIGSYLHDNLAQTLITAKLKAYSVRSRSNGSGEDSKELTELEHLLDESIDNVRELAQDIIPLDIKHDGITEALINLKEKAEELYNIQCEFDIEGKLIENLNVEYATNIYFIIQECIKNSSFHGDADHIVISLKQVSDKLFLNIKDNGKGFDTPANTNSGSGLQIIKHRVDLLGGEINFDTNDISGLGTIIACTFPLQA